MLQNCQYHFSYRPHRQVTKWFLSGFLLNITHLCSFYPGISVLNSDVRIFFIMVIVCEISSKTNVHINHKTPELHSYTCIYTAVYILCHYTPIAAQGLSCKGCSQSGTWLRTVPCDEYYQQGMSHTRHDAVYIHAYTVAQWNSHHTHTGIIPRRGRET